METKPSDPQVVGHSVNEKDESQLDLVRAIIKVIGDDPTREGLLDTPKRVVKSWKELFSGYNIDPASVLGTTFDSENYDEMVICKDIELYSMCEHHMLPFYGKVHIGYIPEGRVVGLSKLARLVEVFARRLQIQEKLTQQIAVTMRDVLNAKGVMVVVEAKHHCMCSRGVGKQNSWMVTSSIHGLFKEDKVRSEFLSLVKC